MHLVIYLIIFPHVLIRLGIDVVCPSPHSHFHLKMLMDFGKGGFLTEMQNLYPNSCLKLAKLYAASFMLHCISMNIFHCISRVIFAL